MLKVGDYVTRNKYKNDILFKVLNIKDNKVILSGVNIRLIADANIDDITISNDRNEELDEIEIIDLDNNYFYIPGVILHLDSDKDYLERCMNYYKKNKIKCYGFNYLEKEYKSKIKDLIHKYNPSIVVITGHDAKYGNNKYKNSKYFIDVVKYIRNELNRKDLIIVSGACQSDFIGLIKNGSNFASSPAHINIHALDPAIIATNIALSEKNQSIDLNGILSKTKYGSDGIGGINTSGVMIIGYPRKG